MLDQITEHVSQMNSEWERYQAEQRRLFYIEAAKVMCRRCRLDEPLTVIASNAFAHHFTNNLGAKRLSRCIASPIVAEVNRISREIAS